jgi:hypothetical protein
LSDIDAPPTEQCANCGAALAGRFCHVCGQRDDSVVVPLRRFVVDGFREALSLEGQVVGTLKALVLAPGDLTLSYLQGRRARFISPVRLYLLTSVVFATALAFNNSLILSLPSSEPDRNEWLRVWLWLVLPMMLVFAVLLMLATSRRRYFVEHLAFTLHFHAFSFLLASLPLVVLDALPASLFPSLGVGLVLSTFALALAHLVFAFRRVYAVTLGRAVASSAVVAATYLVIQVVTLFGVGLFLGDARPVSKATYFLTRVWT